MSFTPKIRVQADDFNLHTETTDLVNQSTNVGALVSFVGLCRDEEGLLAALELEHYPGMAEGQLADIAAQAAKRWPLSGATIIHRHGKIKPGENIVLVITASKHRRAAFEAADFIMDFLKTDAPFWKKEHRVDGSAGAWVEAKQSDDSDRERWLED